MLSKIFSKNPAEPTVEKKSEKSLLVPENPTCHAEQNFF
jgi:hypothetical protein